MDMRSLAKITKGTRHKTREVNLLEVAEVFKSFHSKEYSLERVAKITKLSPEMVREFLIINNLDERVKSLIKRGLIKSVDVCYRISKLKSADQFLLAKEFIKNNFTSDDIRNIVKYKLDNPDISINNAIERVIKSKNKKIFVAYLGIEESTFDKLSKIARFKNDKQEFIKSIFLQVIPQKSILHFELNGRVVIIKLSKEGLQIFRIKAYELKVPLRLLADVLLNEHFKERSL